MLQALLICSGILAIAVAVVLVLRFRSTRNVGYLLLAIGVGIWPVVDSLIHVGLRWGIDRAIEHKPTPYPFSIVTSGRVSVGTFLVTSNAMLRVLQLTITLLGFVLAFRTRPAGPPDPGLSS